MTKLIAKKDGSNFQILAEVDGKTEVLGDAVAVDRGFEGKITYRGAKLELSPATGSHSFKNALSAIRFFVDQTDTMKKVEAFETKVRAQQAISSPEFSHSRAGDRLMRNDVLVYHFDRTSPTGVKLHSTFPAVIADPILRKVRNTSALSPTER